MMSCLVKEYTKNKGSTILSCIYAILTMLIVLSIIVINNLIIKSGQTTDEVLIRIFNENRLNEIYYDDSYTLTSISKELCGNYLALYNTKGKYFKIQDANGTFNLVYNYKFDTNGDIIFLEREVFCE